MKPLRYFMGDIPSNDHLKIMLMWVQRMAVILILGEIATIVILRLCGFTDGTIVIISVAALGNMMSMSIGIIIARITLRDSVSLLDKKKKIRKR